MNRMFIELLGMEISELSSELPINTLKIANDIGFAISYARIDDGNILAMLFLNAPNEEIVEFCGNNNIILIDENLDSEQSRIVVGDLLIKYALKTIEEGPFNDGKYLSIINQKKEIDNLELTIPMDLFLLEYESHKDAIYEDKLKYLSVTFGVPISAILRRMVSLEMIEYTGNKEFNEYVHKMK